MKLNFSYLDTEKDWYVTPSTSAKIWGCTTSGTNCGYVTNTPAESYMADIQFILSIFNNHILTFGGSFKQDYANTKDEYLNNWKDENSKTGILRSESKGKGRIYSFFIQDEIILFNNLTAYVGFRHDWWKTYDGYSYDTTQTPTKIESYPSKSKSSFSPKFALVYKPFDSTTMRGSVGKAFRPPTVYELYRTWRSSTGTIYLPNPYLDPETVISWDIGIEQKLWKGAKVSLTYFENYMKDLIYRKSSGTYRDYINVGKAESRGVEFEIEQKVDKWLRVFSNFTYTDSEIKENQAEPLSVGKRLTYNPLWKANIGAVFEKSGFSTYIVGRYIGKIYADDRNRDYANNIYGSYDPYFVVDGRIAYQITKFAKLSFSVDNIFDRKYYYYYRAPGRSWFTELTLKF